MPAKKTIKRKSEAVVDDDKTPKKVKGEFARLLSLSAVTLWVFKYLHFSTVSHRSFCKEPGQVLVLGQGDVGQLGHGEDVYERKKPSLVSLPEKTIQVVAGGMHTVCLSESGHVRDRVCWLTLRLWLFTFQMNSRVFGLSRSIPSAATTKAPSAGRRRRSAPRWSPGRCR